MKKRKSLFRRINEWLHLWLGLATGVVVFVVCFTAAIWVFRDEVAYFTKPFNRIPPQDDRFLPPSALKQQAQHYLDSALADRPLVLQHITYRRPDRTAYVGYLDTAIGAYMGYLHLNPYTGRVVHNELFETSRTRNFFLFVRAGHRFFWLPRHIGSPFVGACCIIFLITLITGLIWWYPKKWTKSTRKKSFAIKWNGGWKRINLDLHNVLGFYTMLLAFILTYTGVYYSFGWFRDGYHYLLGEHGQAGRVTPAAMAVAARERPDNPVDVLWEQVYYSEGKSDGILDISFPADTLAPITVTYNPDEGRYYRMYTRHFDQHSLVELTTGGLDSRGSNQPFETLTVGQKIIRTNFDVHVGTIGGLPTKILACLVSLVGASLPVTGFIVWYNRKWGKRKKRRMRARQLPVLG